MLFNIPINKNLCCETCQKELDINFQENHGNYHIENFSFDHEELTEPITIPIDIKTIEYNIEENSEVYKAFVELLVDCEVCNTKILSELMIDNSDFLLKKTKQFCQCGTELTNTSQVSMKESNGIWKISINYISSCKSCHNTFNSDYSQEIKNPLGFILSKPEYDVANNTLTSINPPTVFISYSWDNKEHEDWVLMLATKLRENGVDIILDKWEVKKGELLSPFMEQAIENSTRVICILTPNYKLKTKNLKGGVGYEYSIITTELFQNVKTTKFIPVLRKGNEEESIPISLLGRKHIDMTDNSIFEKTLIDELLREIFNEPKYVKPPLGDKPKFS